MSSPSAFPFLANPPATTTTSPSFIPPPTPSRSKSKPKHRPQPISTHRPSNAYRTHRRRSSTSCSTTSPACLSPITPRTPSAAIAAAAPAAVFGSHSYQPRAIRSKSQVQFAALPSVPPPPSPSPQKSRGSPRRRRTSPPSSPFAPPSPMRARSRADSLAYSPVPSPARVPPAAPPRLPKLSKIRSLTNLRGTQPPHTPRSTARKDSCPRTLTTTTTTTMITTVAGAPPSASAKRAKRSATPAKNSQTFQKYRPMPFVQQMQILQFMEGGTLESHIQRHHAQTVAASASVSAQPHFGHADRKQGAAGGAAGAAAAAHAQKGKNGEEIVHGYAFTDERGMIWFDEEEEWEFACLIPKVQRGNHSKSGGGKLLRMLGNAKRKDGDDGDQHEGWERFGSSSSAGEEDSDDEDSWVVKDDNDDDLRSFGGDVAVRRPEQSVLKISASKPRPKGKQRRKRLSSGSKAARPSTAPASTSTTPRNIDTKSVRQEFLSASFVPSPTALGPSPSPKPSSSTSSSRKPTHAAHASKPSLAAFPGMFKRNRAASQVALPVSVSTPTVNLNVPHRQQQQTTTATATLTAKKPYAKSANPSAVSLARSGEDEDEGAVQWAWTSLPASGSRGKPAASRPATSAGVARTDAKRSVSPPLAAAKRLGIEHGVESVSLEPGCTSATGPKKKRFWGRK